MERLVQILDDLDDLFSMLGLVSERLRNVCLALLFTCVALTLQIGGVFLALTHPPLALAMVIILFVTLLYRSVTSPRLEIA
jgi:Mg2+/Co2+ transporter CorB